MWPNNFLVILFHPERPKSNKYGPKMEIISIWTVWEALTWSRRHSPQFPILAVVHWQIGWCRLNARTYTRIHTHTVDECTTNGIESTNRELRVSVQRSSGGERTPLCVCAKWQKKYYKRMNGEFIHHCRCVILSSSLYTRSHSRTR